MTLPQILAIVIVATIYISAFCLMLWLSNKRIDRRNHARQQVRDIVNTRLFMEGKR